jgi:hypothetical protein
MTRGSIKEYVEAIKGRYFRAIKREKSRILDEFTEVTGCHRKAAIRRLRCKKRLSERRRCGRPRLYGNEVVMALRTAWEATDRLCSKRLQPFLPELIPVLRRCGEKSMTADVEAKLIQMSPSTVDRLLHPWRNAGGRHPLSTTRPGSLLKSSIPIRTFADWEDDRPGFLEADLVAHCGESVEGFYLTTLSTVDVASGWSECIGVWGKGQDRVKAAVHRIRQRLPFPLLGLDSDNGSEFINQHLYNYCRDKRITFTRSRSYKKNDSCYVEQKNWSVVRRLIGYDRYNSRVSLEALNRVYNIIRLYVNFFQPVMKLTSKTRHGARVHKVYDMARTPYRRLLESSVLTEAKKHELAATYRDLNPNLLLKQINKSLEDLWNLADRPGYQQKKSKIYQTSVT